MDSIRTLGNDNLSMFKVEDSLHFIKPLLALLILPFNNNLSIRICIKKAKNWYKKILNLPVRVSSIFHNFELVLCNNLSTFSDLKQSVYLQWTIGYFNQNIKQWNLYVLQNLQWCIQRLYCYTNYLFSYQLLSNTNFPYILIRN